jgi:probable F420-dependent oxidoreductase
MGLPLPIDSAIRFGIAASATDGPRAKAQVETIKALGYEVMWAGDHVAFTGPINDPLTQLSYLGALAPELRFGTSVYLLPLRNPVATAKVVATLDRMLGPDRFIFGVGVGGEFAREYQACGIPLKERGGRMNESIALIKRLWNEDKVEHRGKYFSFDEILMAPKPLTPGGPPIWIGGRAEAALKRAARLGDGWMPYVITAKRMADGLEFIAAEADRQGRKIQRFGAGVLIFCTLDQSYERALEIAGDNLSKRYASDFREPAKRYCALGRPEDVAAKINEYVAAGARDFEMDIIAPDRSSLDEQLERFAKEVIPLLRK